MRHGNITALAIVAALAASTNMVTAQNRSKPMASKTPSVHVALAPGDLQWGPAPSVLPAGAQVAVIEGDPFKPGFFSLRLKMPDGYRVAPHWHPTDEHIVVIQGTFKIGMGDMYDAMTARELPAGGFTKLPQKMHHYAGAKGDTIIQIYGQGPFVINYIRPEDNPSHK